MTKSNLKRWQPKRRLSTIFNDFDNDLNAKLNTTYLYLGGVADIQANDRYVAKIFYDLLDCWVKGAKYIIRKEALGLDLIEKQIDFFFKDPVRWRISQ